MENYLINMTMGIRSNIPPLTSINLVNIDICTHQVYGCYLTLASNKLLRHDSGYRVAPNDGSIGFIWSIGLRT